MRKIDTKAYNKRLHSELMELDKLLNRINPEHVNYFDSELIKTAVEYQKLLSECVWADNSNVNGIEMSKVKQLLSYIKSKKKRIFVNRELIDITTPLDSDLDFSSGVVGIGDCQIKSFPNDYDGRNSFVYCQVVGIREDEDTDGGAVYKKEYLSTTELIYDKNGVVSGFPFVGSGYSKHHVINGGSAFLTAVKNSDGINISYRINKQGAWTMVAASTKSDFVRLYLDVFYVMWR